MKSEKKYTSLKGVRIQPQKVPKRLRSLLPYAKEWCFLGDTEVYRHLKRTGDGAIREFVRSCEAEIKSLERYCFGEKHPTPVPDEVVLFQTMYQNFLAARSHLSLLDSEKSRRTSAK
jgi:hypothetical protein